MTALGLFHHEFIHQKSSQQILDWYKKSTGKTYEGDEDPGVQSVKRIFNYYKQHNYKTIVMGASFRNVCIYCCTLEGQNALTYCLFIRSERSRLLLVLTSLPSLHLCLKSSRNPPILFPGNLTPALVSHFFCPGRNDSVDRCSRNVAAQANPIPKVSYIDNEPEFRWALLQDQMAFDKLHEGIKKFAEDGETLKKLLREKISA